MIEQSGIYKADLYENNDLVVVYRPDGRIKSVSTSGDTISIENSDCDTIELNFNIKHRRSGNDKAIYRYAIEWKLLGLSDDNLDIIRNLKKSIYGWVSVITFYNKKKVIVLNPFRLKDSAIDNNASNHYNITIENIVFGNRYTDFVEIIRYLFEDGVGYNFEDENKYIFE